MRLVDRVVDHNLACLQDGNLTAPTLFGSISNKRYALSKQFKNVLPCSFETGWAFLYAKGKINGKKERC